MIVIEIWAWSGKIVIFTSVGDSLILLVQLLNDYWLTDAWTSKIQFFQTGQKWFLFGDLWPVCPEVLSTKIAIILCGWHTTCENWIFVCRCLCRPHTKIKIAKRPSATGRWIWAGGRPPPPDLGEGRQPLPPPQDHGVARPPATHPRCPCAPPATAARFARI